MNARTPRSIAGIRDHRRPPLLPYPMKLSRRNASSFVIEYELRPEKRIIHMGNAPKPGKPSQLGHSVRSFRGK